MGLSPSNVTPPVAPSAPSMLSGDPDTDTKAQQLRQMMFGGNVGVPMMQPSVPLYLPQLVQTRMPAAMDLSMPADPEFAKLETKSDGIKAAKDEIKVP